MPDFLQQPWLAWTIAIAVGVPILLVMLTEVHNRLVRNRSSLARAVAMLRNFVVPTLALLLLLTKGAGIRFQVTGVRLVATVFALLLLVLVLSSLNAVLFRQAAPGSWRHRLPSIFIDIGRVVIVGVGLAILLSQVWGADVGALFTALGVTSIVIGLALQNAVGSIVSGLLLLFEQPFTRGDYLQIGTGVQGRVIEVNWRSVHIDTGNAVTIIPNSSLASATFANLSRPTMAIDETLTLGFAVLDPPLQVCALIERVAAALPMLLIGSPPRATVVGAGRYEVVISLGNLADIEQARSQFLSWLWYASRRDGLHLDGADPTGWASTADVEAAARSVGPALYLTGDAAVAMAEEFELVRYGTGETLQPVGTTPTTMGIVISGELELQRQPDEGQLVAVGRIERNGYVHPSALTREPLTLVAVALEETVVMMIAVATVQELAQRTPTLARELSEEIDRQRAAATALVLAPYARQAA